MPEPGVCAAAEDWRQLADELLKAGHRPSFRVRGVSMRPTLWDGDSVQVEPLPAGGARRGDIVAFAMGRHLVVHRVLTVRPGAVRSYLTAGDGRLDHDGWQPETAVLGHVVSVRSARGGWRPASPARRSQAALRVYLGLHPRIRAGLASLRDRITGRTVTTSRGRVGADA